MMNIYDVSKKSEGEERVDTLFNQSSIRIERIISSGETSGWYDQIEDEWVLLIDGTAVLEVMEKNDTETERITLVRGDSYFIPAGTKHRVVSTSVQPHCIWLCVFIETDL